MEINKILNIHIIISPISILYNVIIFFLLFAVIKCSKNCLKKSFLENLYIIGKEINFTIIKKNSNKIIEIKKENIIRPSQELIFLNILCFVQEKPINIDINETI